MMKEPMKPSFSRNNLLIFHNVHIVILSTNARKLHNVDFPLEDIKQEPCLLLFRNYLTVTCNLHND